MRTAQYGNRITSMRIPNYLVNIWTSPIPFQVMAKRLPMFQKAERPPGRWARRPSKLEIRQYYSPGVCAGVFTFSMELGFLVRMKEMTCHSSSEVLMIPPKGGIGPTTTSVRTRL
jgi:hypothetical protein